MKLIFCLITIGFLATSMRSADRDELQFSGYFTSANVTFVSLYDSHERITSKWLRPGDGFEGCRVISFDYGREELLVEIAGQKSILPLMKSKVKAGKMAISGTITASGDRISGVHAVLFLGEQSIFPVGPGVNLALLVERKSDGNLVYYSHFELIQADGKIRREEFPPMTAAPGMGFGITLGDLGYDFKP